MAISPNQATTAPDNTSAAGDIPRFRPEKTVEQIMAEQGITGPQDVDALFGSGSDLWETDEEFQQFQDWLRESRREDR
jgi:hypothetical protein